MKSTTSCFNKTIFQKDLRLFWPVWIIAIIITQFGIACSCLVNWNYILQAKKAGENTNWKYSMVDYVSTVISTPFYYAFLVGMALIAAILVYQYMNRSQSAFMIHSFPINRKTLFVTHYLSGLTMIVVPVVLMWVVIGIGSMRFQLHMMGAIVQYLIESIIVILFFYSMAVVLIMMSGNSATSAIMFGVLNVLYCGFRMILSTYVNMFLYGINVKDNILAQKGSVEALFTPLLRIMNILESHRLQEMELLNHNDELATGFQPSVFKECVVYLIPTIIFIAIALLLYKKRKLERVGDTLVFNWCKVIYRTVFTACGSVLIAMVLCSLVRDFAGYRITYTTFTYTGIVFLAAGVVLGYLICDMLLEKTVRIKDIISYRHMGIILVFMVVIFVGAKVYTEKENVVAEEEINSIELNYDGNSYTITDKDTIGELNFIWESINKTGKNQMLRTYTSDENEITYCTMNYNLRDGSNDKFFAYDLSEARDTVKRIVEDKEYLAQRLFLNEYSIEDLTDLYTTAIDDGAELLPYVTKSWKENMFVILEKEIKNGTVTVTPSEDGSWYDLNLSFSKKTALGFAYDERYIYLYITDQAKDLLELLQQVDITN